MTSAHLWTGVGEELSRKEIGERKISWETFSNLVMREVGMRMLLVEMVRIRGRKERIFFLRINI